MAFDEQKVLAFEHLRNVLYVLSDLHADDSSVALDRAREFYNSAKPNDRIEPSGIGWQRLVREDDAVVAQRIERKPSKLDVAGSIPADRTT